MNETNFEAIKSEILNRAKEANACTAQYRRAYESETIAALMEVVKDNFHWACANNVITADLIERFREDFAANDIFLNVDVERGYLLCDSATVEAYDSATVTACGSATVRAYDSAYCTSLYTIECKLSNNAIYRVRSTNTIYYASDGIKFEKQENK